MQANLDKPGHIRLLAGLALGATLAWAPARARATHEAVLEQPALRHANIISCDDSVEWPPFIRFERMQGKKTGQVTGYSIDVIKEIFGRHGIAHTAVLVPWARCLAELKSGKAYQMVLNATYSEQRSRDYLLTRPYYSTTNCYYYSRRGYPKGLFITGLADLKQYRVCGIYADNYTTYGFQPGEVDQGTGDFPALIGKLHAGRCALFLEKCEVMQGFMSVGKRYLDDPELAHASVPGMQAVPLYMMISRAYPHAAELKILLDAELTQMETSGRLAQLLKRVLPR
ncbi:MAG: transporter substrate-binding domain-containing protein [Pseudomonadota bacterium]